MKIRDRVLRRVLNPQARLLLDGIVKVVGLSPSAVVGLGLLQVFERLRAGQTVPPDSPENRDTAPSCRVASSDDGGKEARPWN